jgi:hypothetical protein
MYITSRNRCYKTPFRPVKFSDNFPPKITYIYGLVRKDSCRVGKNRLLSPEHTFLEIVTIRFVHKCCIFSQFCQILSKSIYKIITISLMYVKQTIIPFIICINNYTCGIYVNNYTYVIWNQGSLALALMFREHYLVLLIVLTAKRPQSAYFRLIALLLFLSTW